MKRPVLKNVVLCLAIVLLFLSAGTLIAIVTAGPAEAGAGAASSAIPLSTDSPRRGDEELAYLLVKLELKTRGVIAGHYGRGQSSFPGVDGFYKRWLTKNMILPAAVADGIFAEVVPQATSGRAWVKMVVDEPRNPNNRPDEVARELLGEIKGGVPFAERTTGGAYYYAEPIKAKAACMRCHGEPAGEPDPSFPQYRKNGWKPDQVVGAVVARVGKGADAASPADRAGQGG